MKEYCSGTIKYYRLASFEKPALYHAVFSRHGGISPSPWKSLNFGATVGDQIERVRQNKVSAFNAVGIDLESVYDVYQVHSSEVVQTSKPLAVGMLHQKADAMITNEPGVTLLMRFADCVPILLFDPENHAIGIAHAGWIGTVGKIAAKVVNEMSDKYGSDARKLLTAIGPSIGPDHYQVKSDVIEKVRKEFPLDYEQLLIERDGNTYFDLWKANETILREAGVTNIEIAGLCTQCLMHDWYSHRGEYGRTGRFGIILGLSKI
jgi:purine-nucleoside/S-methyl-5'-thioadenosine phosphorylase / adenosine deaminase